jgi:hypothetical protein
LPMTSRPSSSKGMVWAWMGVGVVYPHFSMACSSGSLKERDAKVGTMGVSADCSVIRDAMKYDAEGKGVAEHSAAGRGQQPKTACFRGPRKGPRQAMFGRAQEPVD